MQIYGILLRFRGIFTENAWKITENMRKIVEFPRNSFHNLFPDDPFSRSFSVVFAVIFGENWRILEKIGEYRRKMENIGDIFPFSFRFYSFSFLFVPQPLYFLPQMLNLT